MTINSVNPPEPESNLNERREWLKRAALGAVAFGTAGAAGAVGAAGGVGAASAAEAAASAEPSVVGSAPVAEGAAATIKAKAKDDALLRAQGRAAFAKTLRHDSHGDVSVSDMAAFEKATHSGKVQDFEDLPVNNEIRLVNPLSSYSWQREGIKDDVPDLPPFPALESEALAEEALELYWMALLRDVKLMDYERNSLVKAAVAELRTTKLNAKVTPQTLFRLDFPGVNDGHFISQMLWMPIPYGAHTLWQAYRTPFTGSDFMTKWDEYLKIANGEWPPGIMHHYSDLYYLRSGRDIGEYVHWDFTYQAFINTASILLGNPHRPRENWPATNPYKTSRSMNGFVSMGQAHVHNAMGGVSDCVCKAAWSEKWLKHRALRPEEYGALVDRAVRGENTGVHPLIVKSEAVRRVKEKFGSALLPQAYPEGAPAHPSYPSGHAATAGACVTILKAMFDEKRVLRFPLQPTSDGRSWTSLDENLPPPTVGGELNKLASNIAMARNFAGIHWRSDARQGLLLGESVAKAYLKNEKIKSEEGRQGWLKQLSFRGFEGQMQVV